MDVLLSYGGQARAQEAAVQQTFRLEVERSSFFYLSSLMYVRSTDPCPQEVKPRPMEPWNAIMHRDWLSSSGLKCLRHPIINTSP